MFRIVSCLPGRLRMRCEVLRDTKKGASFADALGALEGVLDVKTNAKAASVVVCFDPALIAVDGLEQFARSWLSLPKNAGEARQNLHRKRSFLVRHNKAVKIGMVGSLAATFLTLGVSRRAHILAGSALTGFLLLHMALYRRNLFR